ncbi:hypothetical protein QCA50_015022 [Cerrena zonata]|uniref:FAD/NAD(P)-binding domain-containing protein n=1 Tax=Cerrena zonata TaxID=2478898 RepID=A0AAW0FK34_9APHY
MSVMQTEFANVSSFISDTISSVKSLNILHLFSPARILVFLFNVYYILCQKLIIWIFSPKPPKYSSQPSSPHGRIAVIGAGLTGVSSAAHAIAHGFDVVIFEQDDRVGGIWAHVNKTSGLQLNSFCYRFHPGVLWSCAFPKRDEILGEITRIWKTYQLESRTRFKTRVNTIRPTTHDKDGNCINEHPNPDPSARGHHQWIINDNEDDIFDAVVVTVGTCGKPRMIEFEGMPKKEGHEQKAERKDGKDEESSAASSIPEDGADGSKHSAWTGKAKETSTAIHDDQEQKRASNLPTPGEAYHDDHNTESPPSQSYEPSKDSQAYQTTAWTNGSYEHPRAVEEDQDMKKEAGFPTPDEAFPTSSSLDPQRSSDSPEKDEDNDRGSDDNVVIKGPIIHSSELDSLDEDRVKGKTIVVIGSGASGVESVETALSKGAEHVVMIAREDKWIIPRNIFIDTLIAAQPFGRQMPLSFIWEHFIIWFNYRGLSDLAPTHIGLFEGTPVVNDEFLNHVRKGRCRYVRGDTERLTKRGVKVNVRERNSKPGDSGHLEEIDADIVVLATGYEKPEVNLFKNIDLFPKGFERPNLYLQNFSTEDWSVLMTNSSYQNAIGTVGHFHIGIYMRILLVLLMDKDARPTPDDMKLWVRVISFVKRGARGGAFGFFTYMELTIWLLLFHIFRPDRLRWLFFIMQGWGVTPNEY